ncbi:CRISPR-associated protein [Nostoc sp. WHI]|uniref:CRISPR-associated protein n=1 Tax=Nostoc sp. WHI TaxID=2650611 RepID=UPI0018C51F9C|nr:CRISPR-associated protein [Nostoc sp. WHI]MBG1271223.1 CRISPR-associated protein [Nostoc sp. WHI]
MPRLVISTVGTSLLTNQIDREYENGYYSRLRDTANCSYEEIRKYHEDITDIIQTLKERAEEKLSGDIDDIREASAELNGIYGLYEDQISQSEQDIHWLIASDTAQDKITAEILQSFLSTNGLNISIYTPQGFSTSSNEAFTQGIDELLNWFEDTIPGYQDSDYEVCFNLVGGFKAIQGFINTIGMFYANKIIYIFEGSSSELITIPRLPIKIDTEVIKPVEFALMAQGAWIDLKQLKKVPETLLYIIGDKALLSNWGRLIWNRSKVNFLLQSLLTLEYIKYEGSFVQDFKNIKDKKECLKLQETIVKVAYLLNKFDGDISYLKGDGGVQLETYKNTDIEHFRVTLSLRVSCKFVSGYLCLRYYGTHDHVERSEKIKGR